MSVSRVHRLLRLIAMLQSHRAYDADGLAEELEVSRRTVFRDLNMLELAHIPYYYDEQTGGYRIRQHYFLPPVNLTINEALALLVLAGRMRGAGSLPLLSAAGKAAMKIENALPQAVRSEVGSLADKLSMKADPVARHEGLDEMFDSLMQAVQRKNVCRLVYLGFDERKQMTLTVHPLRLTFQGRAWYLLGWSVSHGQIRTFKLGRIRKLTVTDRTFMPPEQHLLDGHFGQAWSMIPEGRLYEIHLRFTPKVAGNVAEVRWHDSQRVEWGGDGSIDFYVTVDGLGEILWWILGYGDQVEVLAPKELRGRVADVAERLAERYRKGAGA